MQLHDVFSWFRHRAPGITLRIHVGIASQYARCIEHFPVVIGRETNADLQISDTYVSRTHCLLTLSDGHIVLRDLESRHGTWVNGRQIHQTMLAAGDEIVIGTTWIQVLSVATD